MKIEIKHNHSEGFIEIDCCTAGVVLELFDEYMLEDIPEENKALHRAFGRTPKLTIAPETARLIAKQLIKYANINEKMRDIKDLPEKLEVYRELVEEN